MSDVRDPERDQVAPIPNDQTPCQDLVIDDIRERKEFGIRKYGTPLQPFNGRSFLQDAYEEVLDLAVYLKGRIVEENSSAVTVERGEGEFLVGDYVVKGKGDYQCSGYVVSVFKKLDSQTRVVVEMIEVPGLLHVFAPHQLELA